MKRKKNGHTLNMQRSFYSTKVIKWNGENVVWETIITKNDVIVYANKMADLIGQTTQKNRLTAQTTTTTTASDGSVSRSANNLKEMIYSKWWTNTISAYDCVCYIVNAVEIGGENNKKWEAKLNGWKACFRNQSISCARRR